MPGTVPAFFYLEYGSNTGGASLYPDLPGTLTEVKQITTLFGKMGWDVESLIDEAASKAKLLAGSATSRHSRLVPGELLIQAATGSSNKLRHWRLLPAIDKISAVPARC